MVKLSEEMIVARTRVSDMSNVKKLNCWGAELDDVSVLRKLVNVEVLSLSVNCITSLSDIQNCRNLQELYIRKNKIPDLGEICWLRDLPKLKSLWLEENPCIADQGDLYRLTVIRNLPQLQKLDNVAIQPDEMADAMRRGMELVHPLDRDPYQPAMAPPSSNRLTRQCREESYDSVSQELEQQRPSVSRRASEVVDQSYPPSRRVSNQVFDGQIMSRDSSTAYSENSPTSSSLHQTASYGGYGSRKNSTQALSYSTQMEEPGLGGPEYHSGRRYSTHEMRPSPRAASYGPVDEGVRRMSVRDSYDDERNANAPTSYVQVAESPRASSQLRALPQYRSSPPYQPGPAPESSYGYPSDGYYEYSGPQRNGRSTQPAQIVASASNDALIDAEENVPRIEDDSNRPNHVEGGNEATGPDDHLQKSNSTNIIAESDTTRAIVDRHYELTYAKVSQQIESAQQLMARRKSLSMDRQRTPKNRNSNILSAVLCLLKELDGPSLEVVEMAVRCRMDDIGH